MNNNTTKVFNNAEQAARAYGFAGAHRGGTLDERNAALTRAKADGATWTAKASWNHMRAK